MRESDICLLRRDGLSIKRRQERSSGQSRLGHRPVNNRWPLSSKVLCEASSQTQIARPQEILCIDQLTETFAVKKKIQGNHQDAVRKCSQEEPWPLLRAVCEGTIVIIIINHYYWLLCII